MVAIVWFRNDLRLRDHLALEAAIQTGQPVFPIYIYDDHSSRPLGGASKWWLHHSLSSLKERFKQLGADLILRKGNAFEVLKSISEKLPCSHIFWHRRYDQQGRHQDQTIKAYFKDRMICQSFNGSVLFESPVIKNKQGNAFKVFTPFWKHCLQQSQVDQPVAAPSSINFDPSFKNYCQAIDSFDLLPKHPNWAAGFHSMWQPGEEGARHRLQSFLDSSIADYKTQRNTPATLATSSLSPYIRWGEISVRDLWYKIRETTFRERCEASGQKFLTELGWREFCTYTLFHYPTLANQPLRQEFKHFLWNTNETLFKAWTKGQTGYPLVDAGMRQLWATGYMHNRVRMVTASFLTKHLLQPWQKGEEWFWDTLVDADLASNAFNWQWVAGCGADAAPYFRIFNPTLQAIKFDPKGDYIKQWIPELQNTPHQFIHEPWRDQTRPQNYPQPIISHQKAREKALLHFKNLSL